MKIVKKGQPMTTIINPITMTIINGGRSYYDYEMILMTMDSDNDVLLLLKADQPILMTKKSPIEVIMKENTDYDQPIWLM